MLSVRNPASLSRLNFTLHIYLTSSAGHITFFDVFNFVKTHFLHFFFYLFLQQLVIMIFEKKRQCNDIRDRLQMADQRFALTALCDDISIETSVLLRFVTIFAIGT